MIRKLFLRLILVYIFILTFYMSATHGLDEKIHNATQQGDLFLIKRLLLKYPGLANARNYKGWTPLHLAAYSGHKDAAQLLISKKAELNARSKYNNLVPLHLASLRGHRDLVELLVANGAEVNIKDNKGRTPLHLA